MAPLPVICKSCGTFFLADNIVGGVGAAQVTVSNVSYGPCPVCGGTGRVLDGTYEFVGHTVRMLTDWSPDRLVRLAALLHDAAHGGGIVHGDLSPENVLLAGDPNQTILKLEEAEPTLAARFKPKSSAELAAWLTLLWMVVQTLLGLGPQKGMSDKDIEKIVRTVTEQVQEYQRAGPGAARRRAPAPAPRDGRRVVRTRKRK